MLLALLLLAQNADPIRIDAAWDGRSCSVRVDGVSAPVDGLDRAARNWARQGRPIRITGDADVPYRCIGGTLFTLQSAGYYGAMPGAFPPTLDVELETTVRVFVPVGKCAAFVNDTRVSAAELEVLARDWTRFKPEIHFQPDPEASYACVDSALALLKRAKVKRLGFIGNEQYRADTP